MTAGLRISTRETTFDVAPGTAVVLGGDPSCDVRLSDPEAVGRQASIVWSPGDEQPRLVLLATGLESRVNGQPVVHSQPLGLGDCIQIGRDLFQVCVSWRLPDLPGR